MSDIEELKERVIRPSWKASVPHIAALAIAVSALWVAAAAKPYGLSALIAKAAKKMGMLPALRAIYPSIPYILLIIFVLTCIYSLRHIFTRKYIINRSGITVQKYRSNATIPIEEISEARIVWQSRTQKALNVADISIMHKSGKKTTILLRVSKPKTVVEYLREITTESKKKGEQELRASLECIEGEVERKESEKEAVETKGEKENAK